jgi:putative ABC transport system substrate-binding protein
MLTGFRRGLTDEALTEGRDFIIEYSSEPRIEQLPAKIAEVLKRDPVLLVATTTPVAQAAAKATPHLPIVFNTVSDPVGSGLVASLARPGNNVTGVSNMLPELSGKLLDLVRELLPGATPVAVLWNPDNPAKVLEVAELRIAAKKLSVDLAELPVRSLPDIERALEPGQKNMGKVLVILAETLTGVHSKRIDELLQVRRIAVISNHRIHTLAGGLLSYAPDYAALHRRLGGLTAKILKGAKPAEIPVELPTKFEILVNLKTAKMLGLTIPQSILIRADRVIE